MATSATGPAIGANIEAYRGDSFERWVRIRRNGVEENFDGSTFTMHIKSGSTMIHQLTSTNNGGIDLEQLGRGVLVLSISAEKMGNLNPGTYQYDMQQHYPDGKVRTRFRGTFTITDDVTKLT
jgi:hypothetical protein